MNFDPNFDQNFDNGLGGDASAGLLLPPWERKERYGFLNALYLTIKDVLLTPGRFFHRMPSAMGLIQPLQFAIVLGVIATFLSWMWSLAVSSVQILVAENIANAIGDPLISFFIFLFSPILVGFGVFLQAGLIHLMLMLLGGNNLGFEATFRVAAYGEATSVLLLVPICGSFLAVVWSLVVTIIGIYSIHDTEPWKAVLAVLLPMIFCFAIIGGSFVALLAGGMHW